MRSIVIRGIVGLTVFLGLGAALADRMLIPFTAPVQIFEPKQRAVIAWNGREEIMLLDTDLKASEKTKVLEVLPLPSEPAVKRGDSSIYKKAVKVVSERLKRRHEASDSHIGGPSSGAAPARLTAEVTFHEKIGAHDISVAHVLDSRGFVEWVDRYLTSIGAGDVKISLALRELVDEYVENGFTWFVFDIVELGQSVRTNEAIQYRFKTDRLFYPLKITRTAEGQSTVSLVVITDAPMRVISCSGRFTFLHPVIIIKQAEAVTISEDMAALFPGEVRLRIWEIRGPLTQFDHDLVALENPSNGGLDYLSAQVVAEHRLKRCRAVCRDYYDRDAASGRINREDLDHCQEVCDREYREYIQKGRGLESPRFSKKWRPY